MERKMKMERNFNELSFKYLETMPAQWPELKQDIIRRAHERRTEYLRVLLASLFAWSHRAIGDILAAVFTPKLPQGHTTRRLGTPASRP